MNEEKRTQLVDDLDQVSQRIAELEESEREHTRAEKELRESMDRYRLAVDGAPLGVFAVDVQGRIKYANSFLHKKFALDPIDNDQKIDVMEYPAFADTGVAAEVRRCLETQKQTVFEHPFEDDRGQALWLRHHFSPILEKDGSINGVLAIVDDISEEKRNQTSLSQQLHLEKSMHTVLSRLTGFVDFDDAVNKTLNQLGEIADASRAFLYVVYADGSKMDNTHEWCSEETRALIGDLQNLSLEKFAGWREVLTHGEPIHIADVAAMPAEAGAEKDFLAQQGVKSFLALPVFSEKKLAGLIGFSSETETKSWDNDHITVLQAVASVVGTLLEKKREEDVEKDGHERFRRLAQASQEGLFLLKDGQIVDTNHVASALTGLKPSDCVGKPFVQFLADRDKPQVQKHLGANSGRPLETLLMQQGGDSLPVELVAKNFFYQEMPLTVVAMRDISGRPQPSEREKENNVMLREALNGTVQALSLTIALRDPFAAGHGEGVAWLACSIAAELGLGKEKIEGLRVTSIVHDIGKVALPTEILTKPGMISEAERNLVENHPRLGFDILKSIKFPWPLAQTVLQHHERMDGSGYPSGLSGEKIILEARIIAVADTVEAMVSQRSYRQALGLENAIEELTKNKGKLYDPQVVDAALKVINEKGYPFKS